MIETDNPKLHRSRTFHLWWWQWINELSLPWHWTFSRASRPGLQP